jgi:hypothetical protein
MANKYLDDSGLSYFWTKLKAYFQEKLISGTNIKTINSQSLLGSGDIVTPTLEIDYTDAWHEGSRGYDVSVSSLAGGGYLGQAIDLGVNGDKVPLFNGFDISGTGTARIHTLGHYIYKVSGRWTAYVKMRNDNTTAITNFTVTAYIAWV